MHQRRITTHEIDADGAGRLVDRAAQVHRIATRTFGQDRNRRNCDAFVRDANSDLVGDLVDGADQTGGGALTRPQVFGIDSETQSRRLKPSVTVRMSRCSISVIRTVCRISA